MPDGYHEIRTVLQTIDWYDEIRIERVGSFRICVPWRTLADDSNLVVRAVREFERATGQPVRARIELTKTFPSAQDWVAAAPMLR